MPPTSLDEVSDAPAVTFLSSSILLPTQLILFPRGIKLTSTPLIGTWLNNTCTPKPVGLRWVPGPAGKYCELALVAKGITAVLNEYILREWTTAGLHEVLAPSFWTSEQRDR